MDSLSVKCDKHPDEIFLLQTGTNRHDYVLLDDKGLIELMHRDLGSYETFVTKVIDHFSKCDGQMARGPSQTVD